MKRMENYALNDDKQSLPIMYIVIKQLNATDYFLLRSGKLKCYKYGGSVAEWLERRI